MSKANITIMMHDISFEDVSRFPKHVSVTFAAGDGGTVCLFFPDPMSARTVLNKALVALDNEPLTDPDA